ncbi:dehydrogenase/reductase SDR family member 9-like [Argiope bruennichi]|uniref:dehydrogenase/reductase SDR family member 9-like n=1 Tax=Argiope bruennichi TaxID=94029 RepID=UPI002495416E|nr:dehydrogenase/reductase SDR family member 9-like [Argiope bruennichi]
MSQVPLVIEEYARRLIYFSVVAFFFSAAILISIIVDLIKKLFLKNKVLPHGRAVFVTGCDTGFGNALAKRLDSKGFHVFATCLFPTGPGATELKASCSNRLHVLYMDVTKDESVEKALEYVKASIGTSVLWAIVNNAGILKAFSVELSSIEDFKDCLDVNLLGYMRVIKAFLPLLKQTKGRIVNVTSGAGEIALPYFTPYTTSKFASIGFTDCLRLELVASGISVVSIEPELFATGLLSEENLRKNLDAKMKRLGATFKEHYDDDFAASFRDLERAFLSFACPKISYVIDDLESAVSLVHPHHTYKPRRHLLSRFFCFYYKVMPKSCQIMLMKLVNFIFFSKFEAIVNLKNIMMKAIPLL